MKIYHLAALLLVLATMAHAAESSSQFSNVDKADGTATQSIQLQSNVAITSLTTVLNTVKSTLDAIKNCNLQNKLWNGTACVDPASGGSTPKLAAASAIVTEPTALRGPNADSLAFISSDKSCGFQSYSISCGCTAQQQMPNMRTVGTMLLIEPHVCVPHTGMFTYCADWYGPANVWIYANQWCAAN